MRTLNVRGEGGGEGGGVGTEAQCGQLWTMGEGVKNWRNLADVFYGWPLVNFCRFIKVKHQISFTICMFLPFKGMFLNYQFRLFIYFEFLLNFRIAFTKIHLLFFMVMFFTKFLKACIINAYFWLWIFDALKFKYWFCGYLFNQMSNSIFDVHSLLI